MCGIYILNFSVKCGEKRVKDAYHIICKPCAEMMQACGKCQSKILAKTEEGNESNKMNDNCSVGSEDSCLESDDEDFDCDL